MKEKLAMVKQNKMGTGLPALREERYQNFQEFWPFYLSQHGKQGTRWLHLFGTTTLLLWLLAFLLKRKWWYLPSGIVSVYGCAWIGHFFIENNKPATFTYPFYSFLGDFKMYGLAWQGKLNGEIEKLPLLSPGE